MHLHAGPARPGAHRWKHPIYLRQRWRHWAGGRLLILQDSRWVRLSTQADGARNSSARWTRAGRARAAAELRAPALGGSLTCAECAAEGEPTALPSGCGMVVAPRLLQHCVERLQDLQASSMTLSRI